MNLAQVLLRHADGSGSNAALVFEGQAITYQELRQQSGTLAATLLDLGVGTGDRVLFYSQNRPEHFVTLVACAWIGAVFAPVHPAFKASELSYVAGNAAARLAFVDAALLDEYARTAADIPSLPRRVVVLGSPAVPLHGDSPLEVLPKPASMGEPDDAPTMASVSGDHPVLLCYTSGSTSAPKPVLRSHAGEIWNAETYCDEWDMRSDDRALMSLPLSWVYGLSTFGQALLVAGATTHILSHFNPVTVAAAIEAERISLFAGTNTMYMKMLDVHDRRGADYSSLRHCYIGGEPSSPAAVARFESLVGSRLWQGYAATEAAPIVLTNPRRDASAPLGTVGRLVPGAELRIVDDVMGEVPSGQTGEALLRSPGSMLCYFGEPELTASRVTPDGWFRSGDLVVEEDGYYFVVGRKIDMIIRGGSNIAPAEVESALTSIPGVLDAVVFGVPDAEYGEEVAAVVKTDGSVLEGDDSLIEALADRLARYKVPTIFFRDLDLPEGTTGKRDRSAIRELALASRAPAPVGSGDRTPTVDGNLAEEAAS